MDMINARRAELVVFYNGYDLSIDLAKYLIDFSYTDAAPGEADDIQITLEDRENNWQSPEWSPMQGDSIMAEIRTTGWEKPGEVQRLPLGTFEVNSVTSSGPPDKVSMKATSLPVSGNAKQEKRSKAWEKVTLKTMAADIAKRAGLKLNYLAPMNPTYDRIDQTEQEDLSFLYNQAKEEGIAIKVVSGQLVLFDEFEFEKSAPVATIKRGKDNILSYSFDWNAAYAAYVACEVTYTQAKEKNTLKAKYVPPGAPAIGPVLKINEQADSQAAALRKARKSLREKNKERSQASMTLMGDIRIAAGVTIMVEGFGAFDGKYLIVSATHNLSSSGYTTDMTMRQVLGW
ncbi:contractile injection system protein, VgrG/Pvc8 family [Brevibacillus sp. MER 51]|uniref:phage late control D family protein n=1 Tax=Brevibacillus sp. MER 51 TaxID=2939560 RepID=UPI0020422402|nr:contractile injection system protein, VgrG/Pvc8 family [Brevibacillus sp. MER 51]MCM3141298.1 contractile injection system protein, VgrG/Pvc8 family [Brevibacillus sp. MER 51]